MEIVLTIPDEIAMEMAGKTEDPSRAVLELALFDAFLRGRISERQVQLSLGFEDRFDVHLFLSCSQREVDEHAQQEGEMLMREIDTLQPVREHAKAERSV